MQLVERVLDMISFGMLTKQLGEVYAVIQATKFGGSLRSFCGAKTHRNLWVHLLALNVVDYK